MFSPGWKPPTKPAKEGDNGPGDRAVKILRERGESWAMQNPAVFKLLGSQKSWVDALGCFKNGDVLEGMQYMIGALWSDARACYFPLIEKDLTSGTWPLNIAFVIDAIDKAKPTIPQLKYDEDYLKNLVVVYEIVSFIIKGYVMGSLRILDSMVYFERALSLIAEIRGTWENLQTRDDDQRMVSDGIHNNQMLIVCTMVPHKGEKACFWWIGSDHFLSAIEAIAGRIYFNLRGAGDDVSALFAHTRRALLLDPRNISAWHLRSSMYFFRCDWAAIRKEFAFSRNFIARGDDYGALLWFHWLTAMSHDPTAPKMTVGEFKKNFAYACELEDSAANIFPGICKMNLGRKMCQEVATAVHGMRDELALPWATVPPALVTMLASNVPPLPPKDRNEEREFFDALEAVRGEKLRPFKGCWRC
eukprot:TRINITY_DN6895_c0_g1_i1.p1 TRINITY_DN6895_c0_g1~~TRINITY_DN6895_c0_g1_i1.p1  ORF type:complete len:417 (+),score=23.89 TRINITY_DN6895_c0_g1_i1:15-1265(+)